MTNKILNRKQILEMYDYMRFEKDEILSDMIKTAYEHYLLKCPTRKLYQNDNEYYQTTWNSEFPQHWIDTWK